MDDLQEPYWNALQLSGWVYLGDRRFVRRVSDSVTYHGTFMQQVRLLDGCKEFVETPSRKPNLGTLYAKAARNGGAACSSCKEARDAILAALQKGRFRALGLKHGESDPIVIPAYQWAGLTFYEDKRHRTYAAPIDHSRSGATHWHGLKFERSEVLAVWPDQMKDLAIVGPTQPPAPLDAEQYRPRGARSFEALDAPLVEQMREMLEQEKRGLRRRRRPSGRNPSGGAVLATGQVKPLAQCDDIALHGFPALSAAQRRADRGECEKCGLGRKPESRAYSGFARITFAHASIFPPLQARPPTPTCCASSSSQP